MEETRKAHWETVYATRDEDEVTWFEDSPAASLEWIARAAPTPDSAIIDIGGGASRLVDTLVERGFHQLTVLDISDVALDLAALRLGRRAHDVKWIVTDVTEWVPTRRFDIWHDRAAFHFLVEPDDRAAYVAGLTAALRPGGHAVIATFAADGPERCSGLPVKRYEPGELAKELGEEFTLVDSRGQDHVTPSNAKQRFQFSLFRKRA